MSNCCKKTETAFEISSAILGFVLGYRLLHSADFIENEPEEEKPIIEPVKVPAVNENPIDNPPDTNAPIVIPPNTPIVITPQDLAKLPSTSFTTFLSALSNGVTISLGVITIITYLGKKYALPTAIFKFIKKYRAFMKKYRPNENKDYPGMFGKKLYGHGEKLHEDDIDINDYLNTNEGDIRDIEKGLNEDNLETLRESNKAINDPNITEQDELAMQMTGKSRKIDAYGSIANRVRDFNNAIGKVLQDIKSRMKKSGNRFASFFSGKTPVVYSASEGEDLLGYTDISGGRDQKLYNAREYAHQLTMEFEKEGREIPLLIQNVPVQTQAPTEIPKEKEEKDEEVIETEAPIEENIIRKEKNIQFTEQISGNTATLGFGTIFNEGKKIVRRASNFIGGTKTTGGEKSMKQAYEERQMRADEAVKKLLENLKNSGLSIADKELAEKKIEEQNQPVLTNITEELTVRDQRPYLELLVTSERLIEQITSMNNLLRGDSQVGSGNFHTGFFVQDIFGQDPGRDAPVDISNAGINNMNNYLTSRSYTRTLIYANILSGFLYAMKKYRNSDRLTEENERLYKEFFEKHKEFLKKMKNIKSINVEGSFSILSENFYDDLDKLEEYAPKLHTAFMLLSTNRGNPLTILKNHAGWVTSKKIKIIFDVKDEGNVKPAFDVILVSLWILYEKFVVFFGLFD